jgi:hypothetical protein
VVSELKASSVGHKRMVPELVLYATYAALLPRNGTEVGM